MVETRDRADDVEEPEAFGPSPARALRALALGGLSSAEILAAALVAIAGVAASWATGALRPEDLVTQSWLRALWATLLIAVIRPLTWLPYLGAFAGVRRLVEGATPDASSRFHTVAAHLGAIASITGLVVLVLIVVDDAATFIASAVGFFAGAVRLEDLGTSTGTWSIWRIVGAAVALLLIRPVIPPIRPDLSVDVDTVLGFPPGKRAQVDRLLLWAAVGLAVVVGGLALVAG